MSGFWKDYPQLEGDLKAVVTLLQKSPKTGLSGFDQTLKTLFEHNGKLLRPAYVLIGSYLGAPEIRAQNADKIIALGVAIETLHMATLVHDDIIDEAKMRRGQPSIQSQYGKDFAVYLGDYLLSRALLIMADYALPKELMTDLTQVIQSICLSEMSQFQSRYCFDLGLRQYLRIIAGKTAALFAVSLASGAYLVDAPKDQVKILARIGYTLGMSFQIQDDLMDLESSEATLKKDVFADLQQGYMSLPLFYGLRRDVNGHLKQLLDVPVLDKEAILSHLKAVGALDAARSVARRYGSRGMKFTEKLPEGDSKGHLQKLIPELLNRIY